MKNVASMVLGPLLLLTLFACDGRRVEAGAKVDGSASASTGPAATHLDEGDSLVPLNDPPEPVATTELPKRTLHCDLETKPIFHVGEPVDVIFRLTNQGPKPLWVLRWNNPFEGLIGDCFDLYLGDDVVFFEGRMIKRGDPEAVEYEKIPPGESREAKVDLRAAYRVDKPGRYTLSFDTALFDVVDDESLVPRKLAEHQSFDPHCSEVVFEVR